MTLAPYHDLIARKRVAAESSGLTRIPALNAALKPHQAHCVEFALRAGRAAHFLDTGLGKSFAGLEYGRVVVETTNKPVLMLAPLAVGPQHEREAERWGIDAVYRREPGTHESARIVITNYERLERFDLDAFGGVILDECFAAGTPVDVVDRSGRRSQKHIEKLRAGDRIVNASGIDVVSDVHRREVPYAVRVKFAGRSVLASPNHPFLTERGWVGAQDLLPRDNLVGSRQALRLVRDELSTEAPRERGAALLREILLSEMADAPAGAFGEGSHAGNSRAARRKAASLSRQRVRGGAGGDRAHSSAQSNIVPGSARQDLPPIERDAARTFRAWGQRAWLNEAAGSFDGCTVRQLDGGICLVVGSTDSRISHALQARLGERRQANRHRSGWSLASREEGSRRQEGRAAGRIGLDGIEVLECGHPDLDRVRDADGKLYFYDLGGTRHPSFSVNGALVHNSSIIKNYTGVTTRRLIEAFARTPFRLSATATPAPNDHMELGQQAQFLGAMNSNEMLSRWFVTDQQQMGRYRIKRAAVRPFWEWVSSWARCVSKPSDLGFPDEGYDLPELKTCRHVVYADREADAGQEKDGQARLFRMPDLSATSIHREKRLTAQARAERIADVVALEPGEAWIIWCDTDYEADALALAIPDAVEVRGSMRPEVKEERLDAFSQGRIRILISKPSVAGFGLNWQHCARMAFVGLSFSYEAYYQAVRRCWRFGQTRPVHVHVACADTEAAIGNVVARKASDHEAMKREMTAAMARAARTSAVLEDYRPALKAALPAWMVPA